MKKIIKKTVKILATATIALTVFSALGCKGKTTSKSGATYTYQTTSTTVSTWSPTDQSLGAEKDILDLITMPLYDFIMNDTKDGYKIEPELASDMPEDVTSEYAGKAPWNIPEDAKTGYAFKVPLIKTAKWDNGQAIIADDIEYSLQQYLAPEMKNYRASTFYQEGLPLANAKAYYAGGKQYDAVCITPGQYTNASDDKMYTTLSQKVVFFDDSLEAVHSSSPEYFIAESGEDLYSSLQALSNNRTYFNLTAEIKTILSKIAILCGDTNPSAYKEFCFTLTETEKLPWESVGFIKNDDYTVTFILSYPKTTFMAIYGMTDLCLLRKDLYEANKKQTGDITKSSYGTSVETSASYGPYKVTAYQAEKDMLLEKNEQCYIYNDNKHKGQYQTTGVSIQFTSNEATIMNLFLQGKLDQIGLNATNMKKYAGSEYLITTPQTYTWKFSFNIDKRALKKEESTGINHSILSYIDFRHGISLALDRQKYVDTVGLGSDPAYGLINYLYIADPETGTIYRNTPEAERVLCEFYGTKNISDITGYNKEEAALYFQKAYDAALKAGDISANDKVVLDYHIYSTSEINTRSVTFLQDAINEATKGTSLENKVTINSVIDTDYYGNMKKGNVDIAMTGWGGNPLDPYGILWCYCDTSALNEYGFDPLKETLTITLNGQAITHTYNEWYYELCNGSYVTADFNVRNTILAECEKGLLGYYNMLPVRYWNTTALNSQRVIEGSDHFINDIVKYGMIRFRTYSMNDEEWEAYCKENNYQLTY